MLAKILPLAPKAEDEKRRASTIESADSLGGAVFMEDLNQISLGDDLLRDEAVVGEVEVAISAHNHSRAVDLVSDACDLVRNYKRGVSASAKNEGDVSLSKRFADNGARIVDAAGVGLGNIGHDENL